MNQKPLRISLFIATVAVGVFARSVEIRNARVPIQVPLRLDIKQEARGSFTPRKDTEYFIGVAFRPGPHAAKAAHNSPPIEWTVTGNNSRPVVARPRNRPALYPFRYDVGRFQGQAGVRYTLAATVQRPAPHLQELNPELHVVVAGSDRMFGLNIGIMYFYGAIILLLFSLACLYEELRATPSLRP